MGIFDKIKRLIFDAADSPGMVQAETNTQNINRVMEQTGIAQLNAATLVQTSVRVVANAARMATYQENDDVIVAVRHLATLDRSTCVVCAARDGLEWKLSGAPIGHEIPFHQPPIHHNCRCIMTPRTKTYRELGLDIDDPSPAPRATAGGPFEGTFDDFLAYKGAAYQDEIFGPGRADLYRRGVITRSQLLDQNGNELTLEQLKQRYEW